MEDEKTKIFIEKAKKIHGNKYDYTKTKYVNSQTKVCIICPEHGEFWQTPNVHLDKHGCMKCRDKKTSEENRYTIEQFVEKAKTIHGDKYDYSKVEYCGNETKVCIICPEHGEFWQDVSHHMNGHGCPKCNQSVLENDIIKLLENNDIEYDYNKRYKFLNNLQLDFYIPKFKVAIECQGIQHFKPIDYFGGEKRFQKTFDNDEKKLKLCEKNSIKLFYYSNLHIKYPYKVFENKEDLLKNILNETY